MKMLGFPYVLCVLCKLVRMLVLPVCSVCVKYYQLMRVLVLSANEGVGFTCMVCVCQVVSTSEDVLPVWSVS